MKIGIVGSEQAKFTLVTEQKARKLICAVLLQGVVLVVKE